MKIKFLHLHNHDKPINIGMIGLGDISATHLEAYKNIPGLVVKAFADSNQSILLKKGSMYGITNLYPDYHFMLHDADINVIDVMVPHYMHKQCVCDALRAGKTVICEKPLATTLSDVDEIIRTAKIAKKRVYVKQYLRYSRAYQKLQELIKNGSIGTPYFIQCTFTSHSIEDYLNSKTWRGNKRESGGGVLINIGDHMLDYLQLLFGKPHAVFASVDNIEKVLPTKGEDFSALSIEYPHKLHAHIMCTENDLGYRFRWNISMFGTDGVINVVDYWKNERRLQVIKENKVTYEFTEQKWWHESNMRALKDIIKRIQRDTSPSVSLKEARTVIQTISLAYESARTGKKQYLTQ
jgi:predicted dehydrogenase